MNIIVARIVVRNVVRHVPQKATRKMVVHSASALMTMALSLTPASASPYTPVSASGIATHMPSTPQGLSAGAGRGLGAGSSPGTSNPLFANSAAGVSSVSLATGCAVWGGMLTGTGQITGVVTASDTGLPIASANVRLAPSSAVSPYDYLATTNANDQGQFEFDNLPAGSYKLFYIPDYGLATSSPYMGTWFNNKAAPDAADVLTVGNGQVITNVNAALVHGAQISGTVRAADTGVGLADVEVDVYDGTTYLLFTRTDSNGNYITPGLRSASYRLWFRANLAPEGSLTQLYVSQFYDNQPTLSSATALTVTAPNVTAGVNAQLAHGAVITGQVMAADTLMGLAYADVIAYNTTQSTRFLADASGYYTAAVPSGAYKLYASPPDSQPYVAVYYNNKASLAAADVVTVTAPVGRPNANFALAPGGAITGRLIDAKTGAGIPLVSGYVYPSGATGIFSYTAFVDADAAGYYTSTPGLRTGSYKVGFPTVSGYFEGFYNNQGLVSTIVSATPVSVTAPNTTGNINVALTPCGALNKKVFVPLVVR